MLYPHDVDPHIKGTPSGCGDLVLIARRPTMDDQINQVKHYGDQKAFSAFRLGFLVGWENVRDDNNDPVVFTQACLNKMFYAFPGLYSKTLAWIETDVFSFVGDLGEQDAGNSGSGPDKSSKAQEESSPTAT